MRKLATAVVGSTVTSDSYPSRPIRNMLSWVGQASQMLVLRSLPIRMTSPGATSRCR